ncbi:MAG: AAA family ATPase [Chloroflexi bacterium]|nr:AAA family ATPase [Chloroflexota bacterium]
MESNQEAESLQREKAVALFTYLKELSLLRSRAVRSFDQYKEDGEVLWFSDIPREAGCFSVAWEPDEEPENWIQVIKPQFRSYPPPSAQLAPWLDEDQLRDSSRDMPDLRQTPIGQSSASSNPQVDISAQRDLVIPAHERYVQDQWWPWAERNNKALEVQSVYTRLFSMYQKQQRLGEEYELIVGLGLLAWRLPAGYSVKRHILTAQASLEFDAVNGVITAIPSAEGAKVRLEQDMLDPQDRPQQGLDRIQGLITDMGDAIWDGKSPQEILQTWVNSVPGQSGFVNSLLPQESTTQFPVVHFAPALMLRKRSQGNLALMFERIAKQLEEGNGSIPSGVAGLVSLETPHIGDSRGSVASDNSQDNEVYFPLLSNDEQMRIARSLKGEDGVVVQGPPGTGKSHTIANLVCHLLASGKRVLVTSHTARALEVLRDKFPDDVSGLCVSLLGNDRAALKGMEDSVRAISYHYANWDQKQNDERITRLGKRLAELRSEESRTMVMLRQIRESETYVHSLPFINFGGTLQSLAAWLSDEAPQHSWILTKPRLGSEPPLTDGEAVLLLKLLRAISPGRELELGYRLVDPGGTATDEGFVEAVEKEKQAEAFYEQASNHRQHFCYGALLGASPSERGEVTTDIQQLFGSVQRLKSSPQPWFETALTQVTRRQEAPSQVTFANTRRILDALGEGYQAVDSCRVSGVENLERQTVKADAEALLAHLSQGGGWGFGPFKPAPVKSAKYLMKQVRVNGQRCNSPETLRNLVQWATVLDLVEDLHSYWQAWVGAQVGSHSMKVEAYKQHNRLLGDVLSLVPIIDRVRNRLLNMGVSQEPSWDDLQALASLLGAARAVEAEVALQEAKGVLGAWEKELYLVLARPGVHAVVGELLAAIEARDVQGYAKCRQSLADLIETRKQLEERRKLFRRLQDAAPDLAGELMRSYADVAWDSKMESFVATWNWARADVWLSQKILEAGEPEHIKLRLDDIGQQLRDTLKELAAAKAWGNCLSTMTEPERRSLIAWQQAVRRIGKGTGKYAAQHRREAQGHMDNCRTAIPAWIMPLYRVAETTNPRPGLFDVIIIDEASQSGQEALFLNYIGKQLVVVGDDKQISPDPVGVDRNDVYSLQKQYLNDIPMPDTFSLESSFFDQARVRYERMIRLREHFRCMPEIIQFSNNNFYDSEPLIPLRQFGASRLTPVVSTVYVEGGYRDGNGPNPPEARAIVDKIKSMIADPSYKGKTMGVISLVATSRQDKLIENLLLNEVGPEEMERRKLVCGDPYAFQGDERDVMLLSLVAAPTESHMASLTGARDEQRFNVAASRAKDQEWLFHSVTLGDLTNPESLRYRLLDYCLSPHTEPIPLQGLNLENLKSEASRRDRSKANPPHPFESWFEIDVFLRIVEQGYRAIPQFEIAGYRVDIVVEGMQGRLAVECDGDVHHGPEQFEADMGRQRMLERCGCTFWRVRGSEFTRNPDKALLPLWEELRSRSILPQ